MDETAPEPSKNGRGEEEQEQKYLPSLRTINRLENGSKSWSGLRKCATDEKSLVALTGGTLLERNRLSIVLISLVDQLASLYEEDNRRQALLAKAICSSLVSMGLIQGPFLRDYLAGLRAQYSLAFLRLVSVARASLPQQQSRLPALTGPEMHLVNRAAYQNFYQFSRYKSEFDERELLGGGGFGVVYRVTHRLDQAEYAVKKVYAKLAQETALVKILREVTLLAKVNHPNIVGYRAAWMEPYLGESQPSSSDEQQPSANSNNIGNINSMANSNNMANSNIIVNSHNIANSSLHNNLLLKSSHHVETLSSSSSESVAVPQSLHIKRPHQLASVARIEEVASTPPSWSSQAPKVVGRVGGSFWLGAEDGSSSGGGRRPRGGSSQQHKHGGMGDDFSSAASSSSIVFARSGKNSLSAQQDLTEASVAVVGGAHNLEVQLGRAVLYIQMELCSSTLRAWLDERNENYFRDRGGGQQQQLVNVRDIFHIFQQLLEATAYLHANGILHRDIKPRNIFLTDDQLHVKLGDFGLAKEDFMQQGEVRGTDEPGTPAELAEATFTRLVTACHTSGVGTQAYAAPEQLNSSKVESSSDMFSLGIVLFELCHPFQTEMERSRRIQDLRSGQQLQATADQPIDMDQLIGQLTDVMPARRPSARHLLATTFSSQQLEAMDREFIVKENASLRKKIQDQEQQLRSQAELLRSRDEELERLKQQLKQLGVTS